MEMPVKNWFPEKPLSDQYLKIFKTFNSVNAYVFLQQKCASHFKRETTIKNNRFQIDIR